MILRILSGGMIASLAGAAMLVAVSSSPSPAFTLSSPSGEQQMLQADIQDAYWRHWGWHHHWHHWHHWY